MKLEDYCKNKLKGIALPSTVVKLCLIRGPLIRQSEAVSRQQLLDPPNCEICTVDNLCLKHKTLQCLDRFNVVAFDSHTNFFLAKNLIFRQCSDNLIIVVAKNIKKIKKRLTRIYDRTTFTYYGVKMPIFKEVITFNLVKLVMEQPTIEFHKFELRLSLAASIKLEIFLLGNKVLENYS